MSNVTTSEIASHTLRAFSEIGILGRERYTASCTPLIIPHTYDRLPLVIKFETALASKAAVVVVLNTGAEVYYASLLT